MQQLIIQSIPQSILPTILQSILQSILQRILKEYLTVESMGLHDLGAARKSGECTWGNWRYREQRASNIKREEVSVRATTELVYMHLTEKQNGLLILMGETN